jgi:dTMP kinase
MQHLNEWDIDWGDRPSTGRLIVFCGADGSGKTTQLNILRARLEGLGLRVITTRQPSDWYRSDPFARVFLGNGGSREHARSLALFAAADRVRHCNEVIAPAMTGGAYVLCDRYVFSSLAYFQIRGVDQNFVARINAGIPEPDLSIYLRADSDLLYRRLRSRELDRLKFEERSVPVLETVQQSFDRLGRYLTPIDGQRSIDEVTAEIWSHVRPMVIADGFGLSDEEGEQP